MPEQFASPRGLGANWRQGSLIPDEVRDSICSNPMETMPSVPWRDVTLVVISQDCDLCADAADEPYVEAFPCVPLLPANRDLDAQCRNGRNPRRLVLDLPGRGAASIEQWHRIRIPRHNFAERNPIDILPSGDLECFRRWVGRRYTRAAYPDAFNRRIDSCKRGREKLEKHCAGADAQHVSGIYIKCSDDEIADEQMPYEIKIRVVYPVIEDSTTGELSAAPGVREAAERFAEKLDVIITGDELSPDAPPRDQEKRWPGIPGIIIEDISPVPETSITLHDLRIYKRFDKDYRSSIDRPEAASLPMTSENP